MQCNCYNCLQDEVDEVLKLQYYLYYVSVGNENMCTT